LTEAGYGSRFSQNSQLAQDFSAVGQALQSGDLAGAQQAFASFRQDVQAALSARGQHQQNRGSANNTNAGSTPEIILNLGNTNNNGSPEQITLDFANGGNGNKQLTTGVSNGSGSSEQVTLNLNNLTATPEIILNLSNPGGASQTQSSGNQLSVTA
jgi:hypothetical protein